MIREISYDSRCAIFDVLAEVRQAELQLILGMRGSYQSVALGSVRTARSDLVRALALLDAAEAALSDKPATAETVIVEEVTPSPVPVRLVPRFDGGDAA